MYESTVSIKELPLNTLDTSYSFLMNLLFVLFTKIDI